jgi:L-threonylcarbamoyladenylate synthase
MVMKTLIITTNPNKPEEDKLRLAAEIIKKGGLVAFPTETVYGLGADALNEKAVRRIFEAKKRPADNPLIVHISNIKDAYKIAEVSEIAEILMQEFFPGPLTLVMNKKDIVPYATTGGLENVAVRMPKHKVALKLIELAGVVAAPSANLAGKPSPTNAKHVLEDFGGEIEAIIDAGEAEIGLESTVVDTTTYPVTILRPGAITPEMLSKVVKVRVHRGNATVAKSPGMKYRHYAPKADLIVITGERSRVVEKISRFSLDLRERGFRVGVAVSSSKYYKAIADVIVEMGEDAREIAKQLFSTLREFDKKGVDVIIAEGVEEKGIGIAIMNRLEKASGYRVYRV